MGVNIERSTRVIQITMPGFGLIKVRVASLGSVGLEFKSCCTVELIPGGVDSVCHPPEVSKMNTSLLG